MPEIRIEPEQDQKKGAVAWMAGNSVAANLLMLILLVGGLLWGTRIKQEVFPEFDLDTVTVSVAYPGASPEEVEQGIILAVEEAVQGLDGVSEVTSSAVEGRGQVTVEALNGSDLQRLAQDIQSEVDRITTFPEETEEPQVKVLTRRRQVLSLVLYGDQDDRVLREIAEQVRDTLLQHSGITQVELSSVRDFEISIEVSQEQLRTYGLTLEKIADRIRKASVEIAGGGIKTEGGEILVRVKERRDFGREFAELPIITTNDGTIVRLEDIAVIADGFEDSDRFATYNGKPAVMIDVYRVGAQTPLAVASTVRDCVRQLKDTLPPGVDAAILNDRSEHYQQRLGLLLSNGYLGLALVFVLLGLFLETRLAFWVAMGIPISFLGSLLILPMMGISVNMISMFAYIIALGIVVDDAIVVGENIYKYRQRQVPYLTAAIQGAREVALPVTFSIITNIVAFMPLYFVPGTMGKIFGVIPVVVITVFIISLVESLFVLPAHLGHQRKQSRSGMAAAIHDLQQRFSIRFMKFVERCYTPFLLRTLDYRYVTVSIGILLLVLTLAYVKSGRMGMTLFPRVESNYAFAQAVLPYGSAVEKTQAVQNLLVDAAREIAAENGNNRLVEGIFALVGASTGTTSGGHVTQIKVFLTPPEVRPLNTGEFVKRWRRRVGNIPGLESLVFQSNRGGPGSGAALTVELTHRDLSVLEAASADLSETLSFYPEVKDIDDGFTPGKQQVDFTIRPEGKALGLTAREIASQVRHAYYGAEALRQQRGRNEIKVMVRLPENQRNTEYYLEELMLKSPAGIDVPLREATYAGRGRAYTEINRRNGRRIVTVSTDVDPPGEARRILESIASETLPELVNRYPGLRYGFEGKQADMAESMQSLFKGLILALLVMYAVLAIPFKSYTQPAIVMACIPFGIVGAVAGHLLMGYSLSVMSMFGIVALSGVVVNDSLVLIDFANRQRFAGATSFEALLQAGYVRFRPILLTTLTTFCGLAPMIFESSRQARFLIPMALSLGFGVVFATLITLVLVPSLYLIVEDLHRLTGVD